MGTAADPLRILVAGEDDETYRLLRFILQQEHDLEIVGYAACSSEVEALVRELAPQVVLFDLETARSEMTGAISAAKRRASNVRFAALSASSGVGLSLSHDWDAVLLKNGPLENLADVLRRICDGGGRPSQRLEDRPDAAADPMLTLFMDNLERRNQELEESVNLMHFWLEGCEADRVADAVAPPARASPTAAPPSRRAYILSVDGFFNAQHKVTIAGAEGQLHPHSWRVTARVRQESLGSDHMFLGFADAKRILRQVLSTLDGKTLNDLSQFANTPPTTENISACLFASLSPPVETSGGCLESVTVWESPTNSVTYGEG